MNEVEAWVVCTLDLPFMFAGNLRDAHTAFSTAQMKTQFPNKVQGFHIYVKLDADNNIVSFREYGE